MSIWEVGRCARLVALGADEGATLHLDFGCIDGLTACVPRKSDTALSRPSLLPRIQKVYPADVTTSMPAPGVRRGPPGRTSSCKEGLGLNHFDGRTWRGLHHHALMTLICFAFLQHLRLREIRQRGDYVAGPHGAPAAVAASDSAAAHHARTSRRGSLSETQRAAGVSAARVDVAM